MLASWKVQELPNMKPKSFSEMWKPNQNPKQGWWVKKAQNKNKNKPVDFWTFLRQHNKKITQTKERKKKTLQTNWGLETGEEGDRFISSTQLIFMVIVIVIIVMAVFSLFYCCVLTWCFLVFHASDWTPVVDYSGGQLLLLVFLRLQMCFYVILRNQTKKLCGKRTCLLPAYPPFSAQISTRGTLTSSFPHSSCLEPPKLAPNPILIQVFTLLNCPG